MGSLAQNSSASATVPRITWSTDMPAVGIHRGVATCAEVAGAGIGDVVVVVMVVVSVVDAPSGIDAAVP
ncbi:hypothetical protein [Mycobacteroides franklinii]|uniref:hypothetical protein n=1 Tax=Mycobacteroides franklinii TaxID=948102 RepID=UPI0012FFA4F1|nr:hypothetical protein [Mycobacteroides franklinii]